MSLAEVVGVAIARHPEVSRANAMVTQSRSELAIAKAAWYPTFEYSVRPGHSGDTGGIGQFGGSAGANQLVYDFGKTSSQISAADATLNRQKHLVNDTIEGVAYTTATTFVELSASQDMIAAAQAGLDALRDTREKIKARVSAGLSDASDVNQADVAVRRAEADVLQARTRFDVASGKLAELIGVQPKRVRRLTEVRGFVDALGGPPGAIDRTPAVLAATEGVKAAEGRVRLAEANRFPSVTAGVFQSLATGSGSDNSTWVGLSLNGKFSFGGIARHQIEAAEAEKKAADQYLENQRMTTRTALHAAEREASGAAARLASFEEIIGISRKSRELYWQQYTLNKRPLTDVINAERDIQNAATERIDASADVVIARLKAHTATGNLVALLRAHGEKEHVKK